ncbi:MAG TPA: GNAT family N-acetyltransferase [Ilumatobacter sp.]|nr:GNAT family N-acetyltransferase [Ilumatobacter sp.]
MPASTDRFVFLPSGRQLDLERSRWEGVLDGEEFEYCRRHGIAISYDCAQIGWVSSRCHDDTEPTAISAADRDARQEAGPAPELVTDLTEFADRTLRNVLDLTPEAATELDASAVAVLDRAVARVASERGHGPADSLRWALRSRLFAARSTLLEPLQAGHANGAEVTFRRWTDADVPTYVALLGNPRVWRHLPDPYPDPFTDEIARTLIDISLLDFHHDANAVLIDGHPVGQCVLRFDDPCGSIRAAEVSYWLGEEHWGRGLMSRILPRFTSRSFDRHDDVEAIYAWIAPDNVASAKAAIRAGYHRDESSIEQMVAPAIRRPGWERYVTYRSQWASAAPANVDG